MSAHVPADPLNVIFTCDICQASIHDIYSEEGSGAAETDFQDGRPPSADRRVTCLWLTQCMHLTCGAHLEGGGAPFHPKTELPAAPCPYCVQIENDTSPKALYAVRGLQKGSYHEDIPDILFDTPPVDFAGDGDNWPMEALKFQYLSLIRYGTAMLAKSRDMKLAMRKPEHVLKTASAEMNALYTENKELKEEIASHEVARAEIERWRIRIPKVTHFLRQWPLVMAELGDLRGQLTQLGYAVSIRDYQYYPDAGQLSETSNGTGDGALAHNEEAGKTRVPTDNEQSEYVTAPLAQSYVSRSSSDRKRKLSAFLSERDVPDYGQQLQDHRERDLFAKARDQADTTAACAPSATLRGGDASCDSNAILSNSTRGRQIHTYADGAWESCEQKVPHHRTSIMAPSHQGQRPTDKYAMSGAIPQSAVSVQPSRRLIPPRQLQHADQPQQQTGIYQQRKLSRVYDKKPVEPLKAEPIQRNNGSVLEAHSQSSRNRLPVARPPTRANEAGYAVSTRSHLQQDHQSSRPPDFNQVPVTPLPRRHHAPRSSQVLNQNSSPFFTRGQGGARSGISPALAGLSANARVGTVFKQTKSLPSYRQQDWTNPRSLNGLSFITVPRSQHRNEPLLHTNMGAMPHNVDMSDPFNPRNAQHSNNDPFKRPNQPRLSSSYFNSRVPQPAIRVPGLYTAQRMPPISNFAPAPPKRIFTRGDALNTANIPRTHGATSFYQNQERGMDPSRLQNGVAIDSRGLFSAAGGRRSVRR